MIFHSTNSRRERRMRAEVTAQKKSASRLRSFREDQKGGVIILATVAIPVLLVASSAALTFASGVAFKTNLQDALDATVLAGLNEDNPGQAKKLASDTFQASLTKTTRTNSQNIRSSFESMNDTMTGTASARASIILGNLVGAPEFEVTVNSAATRATIPICVLGLNNFDNGSFDINGNPEFNAECAVHANSKNGRGMTQEGRAPARSRKFSVAGGESTNNFSPPPAESAPQVDDPFKSVPFPPYTRCDKDAKGLTIKTATDLTPGTYCGGVSVMGAKVRMTPGVYVFADGPFAVSAGGEVTGNEVMVGFTGTDSTLRLWGNSTMNLTSPVSGTWKNMQFMVDPTSAPAQRQWVSVGGSGGKPDGAPKLSYDGVAYFGTQNFWIFGNAEVRANSPSVAMAADKVWVQGSASVTVTSNNPRGLDVAAPPMTTGDARLVR
jgi:Flp pilus assembly protein TadG